MELNFEFKKGFGSDNHCAAHPLIMEALVQSNRGHLPSYGTDELCEQAYEMFRQHFGPQTKTYFVFNGSAANTLSLRAMTQSFHSVYCSEASHIYNDECAAPEMIGHCKLIPLTAPHGKVTISEIEKQYVRLGDQHASQPRVISITQPTELGTVYTIQEIKTLCDYAHSKGLLVHMDGARLPNAAIGLNATFKEMTTDLGVDVVSFGGTKNGLVFGEAILFLNAKLSENFQYIRKQCLQLPSKSRFVAAQFLALLNGDLWRTNAEHVLKMARVMRDELLRIPKVEITQLVESNAVFAKIPRDVIKSLRDQYFFYVWDQHTFECRLMMSFDTTVDEIRDFAAIIQRMSR